MVRLRRCGIVVHHAARMPTTQSGRRSIVVFLEAGLDQSDSAQTVAERIPGAGRVSFAGYSRAIMYVEQR